MVSLVAAHSCVVLTEKRLASAWRRNASEEQETEQLMDPCTATWCCSGRKVRSAAGRFTLRGGPTCGRVAARRPGPKKAS